VSGERFALNESREPMQRTAYDTFRDGIRSAWPICMAYVPLGMALGVLAQKAGFHPAEIGLMSVLVFAGSAQFVAVSMISGGADPLSIVLTTFMVNLRHVLMSSSLSVFLKGTSPMFLSCFAYGVTDESFAVNIMQFRKGRWDRWNAIAVNQCSNAAWVLSTILGGYGGQYIPVGFLGIDYALSAMFISLLVLQLRGAIYVLTALISGAAAIGACLLVPGNAYVIIASLLGATAGFGLLKAHQRREARHGAP
jgi:4-azaleucine resistance transporter AzlC